jgi:hypothetical protein
VNKLLVASVAFLAVGLGVILAFCSGTTGLSLGYPFSSTSIHIDITATGIPAISGLALLAIGLLLQVIAWIRAIAGASRPSREPKRREEPFME